MAIVDDISVDFGNGLNVITGETGAGKSILMGALALVLGERADRSAIRTGEEKLTIEAQLHLHDPDAIDSMLQDLDMEPCDEGQLVIRRTLSTTGSGKCFINDCPSTVQLLKRIGVLLVDMHGPHDHQSLLQTDFQMDLLDSFAHLWGARDNYQTIYNRFREIENKIADLQGDDSTVDQQIDFLSHQAAEIEAADLHNCDEEQIKEEHAMISNAARILELASGIQTSLTDGDTSAFDCMAYARRHFSHLAKILPEAVSWEKEAESIIIQIQELESTVSGKLQNIEHDQSRLQELDDKITLIHKLKRKYGESIAEILAHLETTQIRLQELLSREARSKSLEKELIEVKQELSIAASELSSKRIAAGKKLSKEVTDGLKDLGFAHGKFTVQLDHCDPKSSGTNSIEFGFAPNTGETMRPLRAIASSGEISRVMLAVKTVLAIHDKIPILVFDEIDANVGGEIGNAIGEKLAAVAKTHQVICITHLPQVAVHGTSHLKVSKQVQNGRTTTSISTVSSNDRVEEISRMLGGKDITSVVLEHAKEMLSLSSKKNSRN